MEEAKINESNTRTRIKVSITAKGAGQWECSTEYDTPERSIKEMSKAIDMIRTLLKEKKIPEAGVEA